MLEADDLDKTTTNAPVSRPEDEDENNRLVEAATAGEPVAFKELTLKGISIQEPKFVSIRYM